MKKFLGLALLIVLALAVITMVDTAKESRQHPLCGSMLVYEGRTLRCTGAAELTGGAWILNFEEEEGE